MQINDRNVFKLFELYEKKITELERKANISEKIILGLISEECIKERNREFLMKQYLEMVKTH